MKKIFAIMLLLFPSWMMAQNSAPAPGQPAGMGFGNSYPAPGQPAWGNMNGGWSGNSLMFAPRNVVWQPDWQNAGEANVVGCGYDDQGVYRIIPMTVDYNWNGAYYSVMVMDAYNPWTDMWDDDVDQPAYQTVYNLNGNTYNYYAPLSTGTYYFNL